MGRSGGSIAPTIMRDSIHNRGVAFSDDDRQKLNLVGRLPAAHLTLDEQAARTYAQMRQMPDPLHQNIFLERLHDRNETLYYKILSQHLTELLPIVYDQTVGEAIRRYSDEYR